MTDTNTNVQDENVDAVTPVVAEEPANEAVTPEASTVSTEEPKAEEAKAE